MPIRTGTITALVTKVIWDGPVWADTRTPKGTRYGVVLEEGHYLHELYTLDPLRASLCLRAKDTGAVVRVETRDTKWGEDILRVELVSEVVA